MLEGQSQSVTPAPQEQQWKKEVSVVEQRSGERIKMYIDEKREKRVSNLYKVESWNDLFYEWIKCWEERFKGVVMPRWNKKDIAQAKGLIKKIGLENAVFVVQYVFQHWGEVARQFKRMGGIPSIQLVVGEYEKFYLKAVEEGKKREKADAVVNEWKGKGDGQPS